VGGGITRSVESSSEQVWWGKKEWKSRKVEVLCNGRVKKRREKKLTAK